MDSMPQLQQELKVIQNFNFFLLKYFEKSIHQKLNLLINIVDQSIFKKEPVEKLNACLIGLTNSGKSTLLNILIDPQNLKINYKKFVQKKVDENTKISQTCNSETKNIFDFEIDNVLLTDTPGFYDTDEKKRLCNQINIFTSLQRSKQIVFLILIDGKQLCKSKKDLFQTLEYFSLFFGDRLIESNLDQFILPVFNKLEQDTMEEIKNQWDTEIYKDCNQQNFLYLLKVIKDKIDKDRCIYIQMAQNYQDSGEIQNLKKNQQEIQKKIYQLIGDGKYDELKFLKTKSDAIQSQIDSQPIQINYELLKDIKNKLLSICQQLQEEQRQSQSQVKFTLKLNSELQSNYNIILQLQDELCSAFLIMITDIITGSFTLQLKRNFNDIIKQISDTQALVEKYNTEQKQSIFQLFNSLQLIFKDAFKTQNLISQYISQIENVNFLSKYIDNGKQVNKIKIDYLEQELRLLKETCTNSLNNIVLYAKSLSFKWEMFKQNVPIYLLRIFRQTNKVKKLIKQNSEKQEKFWMEVFTNEYLQIKAKQQKISQ